MTDHLSQSAMSRTEIFVAGYDPRRAKAAIQTIERRGGAVALDWTDGPFDQPYRERPDWVAQTAALLASAIARADVFVLLWQPGNMESARWEAGMAVGMGKPVFVSGDVDLFYAYLPNVRVLPSDDAAISEALNFGKCPARLGFV